MESGRTRPRLLIVPSSEWVTVSRVYGIRDGLARMERLANRHADVRRWVRTRATRSDTRVEMRHEAPRTGCTAVLVFGL